MQANSYKPLKGSAAGIVLDHLMTKPWGTVLTNEQIKELMKGQEVSSFSSLSWAVRKGTLESFMVGNLRFVGLPGCRDPKQWAKHVGVHFQPARRMPDREHDDLPPVRVLVSAAGLPPPETTGTRSVFDLAMQFGSSLA